MDREARVQAFQEEIAAVIDRHWGDLKPEAEDDDLDALDLAEVGETYASCWVLVLGASSIANADAPHLSVRYAPRGQLPFTGIGLLEDALAIWKGPVS